MCFEEPCEGWARQELSKRKIKKGEKKFQVFEVDFQTFGEFAK